MYVIQIGMCDIYITTIQVAGDDPDVEYVISAFEKLQSDAQCQSLLKRCLTNEILDQLKEKRTESHGSCLRDVIQSGVENLDSGVGVYAPDAEAYDVFAPLFDPIIEMYHGGFGPNQNHPPPDFGNAETFGDLDPEGKYVLSNKRR